MFTPFGFMSGTGGAPAPSSSGMELDALQTKLRDYGAIWMDFEGDANKVGNDACYDFASLNTSSGQVKFGSQSLYHSAAASAANSRSNASATFDFSGGDFSSSFWFYPTTLASANYTFWNQETDANNYVRFYYDHTNNDLVFESKTGGSFDIQLTCATTLSTSTWYWITIERDGNTWSMYRDGVKLTNTLAQGSYSNSLPNLTGSFILGAYSSDSFIGYLDDFVLLMGGTFWESASAIDSSPGNAWPHPYGVFLLGPEGADASTSFYDRGPTGHTVTTNGDAQVDTALAPYTDRPSALFDGTGDYLSLADSNDWQFEDGAWSVEAWVKQDTTSGIPAFIGYGGPDMTSGANRNWILYSTGGHWYFEFYNTSATRTELDLDAQDTNWHHVSVCFDGTTVRAYVDGAEVDSATPTGSIRSVSSSTLRIAYGGGASTMTYMDGSVSDVRIYKGYATRTAGFSTPSSPVVGDTVEVCVPMEEANSASVPYDTSREAETITNQNNPSITTGFAATGNSSLSCSNGGGGRHVDLADSPAYALASRDFTLEAYVRRTNSGNTRSFAGHRTSGTEEWLLQKNTSNEIRFYATSSTSGLAVDITSTSSMASSTWHHVMVTRKGDTFTLYFDGVSEGTDTDSNAMPDPTGTLAIGAAGGGSDAWDGYVDDFRMIVGEAREVGNFTAPTEPAIPI